MATHTAAAACFGTCRCGIGMSRWWVTDAWGGLLGGLLPWLDVHFSKTSIVLLNRRQTASKAAGRYESNMRVSTSVKIFSVPGRLFKGIRQRESVEDNISTHRLNQAVQHGNGVPCIHASSMYTLSMRAMPDTCFVIAQLTNRDASIERWPCVPCTLLCLHHTCGNGMRMKTLSSTLPEHQTSLICSSCSPALHPHSIRLSSPKRCFCMSWRFCANNMLCIIIQTT